ncbi:MAG TPA: S-ribosylhomocysteine lyase [Amycolatopsis sp.]|nr:S-ribosylhomocysteine lyase [Amycolatopsis sp.]
MADLDHRSVTPPYLRLTDIRKTSRGDIFVWHLRIGQPNVAQIATSVMHSVEHFLGDYMVAANADVIAVAPMGCQTGFYIATAIDEFDELSALVASVLEDVLAAMAVPHADPIQCGWAENHSLAGAQEVARYLLNRRDAWADPRAEAREVQRVRMDSR